MSSEKLTKLETFIERHRPDFDAHEPGPELWARLEQQLSQPGPSVGPVLLADEFLAANEDKTTAAPSTPAHLTAESAALATEKPSGPAAETGPRRQPWVRYGVAAALAVLVGAAVLSEARRPAAGGAVAAAAPDLEAPTSAPAAPADAAAFGPASEALAAGRLAAASADPRLSTAVRGMETYYAAQLSARQAELEQLDAQNARADWPRELASLDSSYQQLKEELPHHPQPEVVLTAMNRNLQIRLDILDQQLAHRSPAAASAAPSGTLVSLADSRSQP